MEKNRNLNPFVARQTEMKRDWNWREHLIPKCFKHLHCRRLAIFLETGWRRFHELILFRERS
jgi:hypothetical protein